MSRIILILIILYVLFRMFRRSIFVYTVNSFQSKMEEQFRKQQKQQQQEYKQQQRQANGKAKVDYIPPDNNKRFHDNDGDYVDYEEIK